MKAEANKNEIRAESNNEAADYAESLDVNNACIKDGRPKKTRPKGQKRVGKKKKHGFLRLFAELMIIFVIAAGICFLRFFKPDEWHQFDASLILDKGKSTLVYAENGELVSVIAGDENRIPVDIETLPKYVKYAFISAEDARFYKHKGFDIIRIFGAAWADIKAGKLTQGASTIGQQLIKLSHLTNKKTFDRKLEEVWLSTRMETEFSKDEILEMYLNYVYFGGGFYGIETAALGYFGVRAKDLSVAQAAQLAGILKSPKNYAPHLNPEKSLARRNNILKLMLEYGHIDENEYNNAVKESCVIKNGIPSMRNYYIDRALREAAGALSMSMNEFLRSGYSVRTGLDIDLNEQCARIINDNTLFYSENAQGALVLLANDGSIKALCGGKGEYSPFVFNRAADMQRQPGSLIKPLLCYAPAIDRFGYTAASILDDSPTDFSGYSPRNSDDDYQGRVPLRYALSRSLNIPAVSVLSDIGVSNGALFAENLGISFENENLGLPLALGGFTYGISPLEAAGAYNAFANGGQFIKPHAVIEIQKDGKTVYRDESLSVPAMSRETAFIMTNMLESAAAEGTARLLSELNIPIAAKTGTNLDGDGAVRDAWTVAYTTEYTAACWLGTDSANDGSLPEGTTGGNSACKFLNALFAYIYKEKTPPDFEKPENVLICRLDAAASAECGFPVLATRFTPENETYSEYFTDGTVPLAVSCYWQFPSPPSRVGWYIDSGGKPVITFDSSDKRLRYLIMRETAEGTERAIADLTGCEGKTEFRDVSALPGSFYVYSVITVHPEISIDGHDAESALSRKMRVYVPALDTAG